MNLARAIGSYAWARLLTRSPRLLARTTKRRLSRVGFDMQTLAALPIVRPREYRAHFERWNTLGIDMAKARQLAEAGVEQAGLSYGLSTGTSGESGVFITSAADRDRYIGLFLARAIPPDLVIDARAAVLLRHDNALYHRAKGRVQFISLTGTPETVAQRLCDTAADIVIGPPSALVRLSETTAFEKDPIRPRLLITGGEPLWSDDKELLKARYGAEIRQVYQTCEGFLAASCEHGQLHFNTDAVHVERAPVVGSPQRFVPIITDIGRDGAQRIARLSMDDVCINGDGPCGCGSILPSFRAVEGRLSDIISLADGLLFPEEVNAAVRTVLPAAQRYEVVQNGEDSLTVRLRPHDAAYHSRVAEALHALAECKGCRIDQIGRGDIETGPLWQKARRTQRLTDPYSDALFARWITPKSETPSQEMLRPVDNDGSPR